MKERIQYRYEPQSTEGHVERFKAGGLFSDLKIEGERRGKSYDITQEGKTIIKDI